jgi:hypothetical protein
MKNLVVISCAVVLLTVTAGLTRADETRLGGMQLLPGYGHVPLQGFDSIVGQIKIDKGLTISYEIGGVVKAGAPRFGGSFSDRPKLAPKDSIHWYREQVVGGQDAHLAHSKDDILMVSFPEKGMNFSVKVKTSSEMADALLMILTYPNPPGKKNKPNPRLPTF